MNRFLYITAFVLGVLAAWSLFTYAPVTVEAQVTATSTVDLVVSKQISGDQHGYDESDFSFRISGANVDETIPHGGTVALGEGTYTIEEVAPSGFVEADWRIGWFGECEPSDDFETTITIDDGNIDHGTLDCQADNQYRPEGNGTSTTTVMLVMEKKFSGTQEGFTVEQFSFRITGGNIDETVAHGGSIELPVGTYTIEEVVPNGFDLNDWTIQWSGECENKTAPTGTIVVDPDDPEHFAGLEISCWADNQFKPGQGTTPTTTDATLRVVKVVVNDDTGTSTASDFSFSVNGGAATAFNATGTNVLTVEAGTYTVVETPVVGYTTTYDNCTDIVLAAGDSATCTITNNDLDVDNGGGGNDDDDDDDDGDGNGSDNDDDDDSDNDSESDGSSRSSSSNNDNDDSDGDSNPRGRVAGEQTTIIPRGAANTGAGGTAGGGLFTALWWWAVSLF